jgi:YVTN family beta-propeller protein
MAEIKRLNYFTYQFLEEKDFDDEQAYHLGMRRRHNRLLHVWGVAEGLQVTGTTGAKDVSIDPGTAIDKDGREIVLTETATYTLTSTGTDTDVYLTVKYGEAFDALDHYTEDGTGVDNYTRTTERPEFTDMTSVPPTDGSEIVLAKIRLDVNGNIASGGVDNSVRTSISNAIGPGSVGTDELADDAVTAAKILNGSVGTDELADGAVNELKLAPSAVGTGALQDDAVTSAKILDGSVGSAELSINAVATDNIQDGAIAESKLGDDVKKKLFDASRIHKVPLLQQTIFGRGYIAATVQLPAGSGPRGLAFDGTHIWVSNYTSNSLSKIDINTNTVIDTLTTGVSAPDDGIAFDGTYIWVSNNNASKVSRININGSPPVVDADVIVGATPYGIACDGSYLWVANYGSGTVSKVNITTPGVEQTVSVGTNPYGIAFDGSHIWVANSGSPVEARKIDISTNQVVASVQLGTDGGATRGVAFDGAHIWVAQLEGWLNKIDINSNTLADRFQAATKGFGLSFDGTHLWMNCGVPLNNTYGTISKIDINSNETVATLTVGALDIGNYCSAFDGTYLWVSVKDENRLVKIKKMI